ncbi:hypothetical protein [Arachnia propionica]|uniref:hypothetical protein n=1 Tax=Arachnia propionica TaxID=1750 RepID=UPI001639E5C2|nr:hypothetical protein [Arachnia propionica]MDO5083055.1 hypothetical protein [Arachnia propionica]
MDIWVSHEPGKSMQDLGQLSPNGRTIGNWTCDEKKEGGYGLTACVSPAPYGGIVALVGDPGARSMEELTKLGDEFIAAWK